VEGLSKLQNVDVLSKPMINQGIVSLRDPSGAVNDDWNDRVIAEINREGTSFFSGTTFQGRRAMRISVSNWQTDMQDVRRTVAGVERALANVKSTITAAAK
jgi:glutamate/tyrosine decarboxylase-like PLP-dependent enzyme